MLKAWQVAAARTAAVARLLARSRTRKGERAQLLLGKVLRRWAELGQSRRRTADAELLEALSSLRAEKAALQSKLDRRDAVGLGDSGAAKAVAELEAMVEEAEGLTPVLQEQVALLKRALAAETDRAERAEVVTARSESARSVLVAECEERIRQAHSQAVALAQRSGGEAAAAAGVDSVSAAPDDALDASFKEGVVHAQEEAQGALVAAREMSTALVAAQAELREEVLRGEEREGAAADALGAKDSELRHLAEQLAAGGTLKRTCDNLRRKLQDLEDDNLIAVDAADRLHSEAIDELRMEAEAAGTRADLKVATVSTEHRTLQEQLRALTAELVEANERAAMIEQVLLRSAAAEAAEVGADVDDVTESVKLLLRNSGAASEPQRKMLAAKNASAIAPTKIVRRLESQVSDLEKKLGGSETARELLAEEASVSRTTCQQLRGALTSCHDTVAKEQKRAAAAARAHGEVKARLQKDIMDLTKAKDALKAQLDQASSRQSSLARRAKLADEETIRAKRSVERVTAAESKPDSSSIAGKGQRDSVRVLASDSLRREAEHKLAIQTLQLRTMEKDCEELSTKLASTSVMLSATESELSKATEEVVVADAAREAAEELAEERTVEAGMLRRQLSDIPSPSPRAPRSPRSPRSPLRRTAEQAAANVAEADDQEDYTQQDPLLRALHRPAVTTQQQLASPGVRTAVRQAEAEQSEQEGKQQGKGDLIERLQKARSALQPSQGPVSHRTGASRTTLAGAADQENLAPAGSRIPQPSPRARKQEVAEAGSPPAAAGSKLPVAAAGRASKGPLVTGLRDFQSDDESSEDERMIEQAEGRRSSTSPENALADYITGPSPSGSSPTSSPDDVVRLGIQERRLSRGGSASGSSFASASFVSAQEMLESAIDSPNEKVAFNPPTTEDGGGSLVDVSFASATTFAPEGDTEVEATFEAPGSLGIVFGNFGRHNSILIKDINPGYPASHDMRLVPGLKLKKVDGQPVAGLTFAEALELVKSASRPVTLSFVDTELPTLGSTLGVSGVSMGGSSMDATTTDAETSGVYSTDRSSIGDSGYTERTLSGGGEMTGDEEAQWWEKAPGWLQDTAKAVGPSAAAAVGVGLATWSEQL